MNRTVINAAIVIVGFGLAGAMWLAIQQNDAYSVVTYGIGVLVCLAISQLVSRTNSPLRRQEASPGPTR